MMQRKPPTTIEEQRPCLLVQTTDGWLKILDACSGECLTSVFVSSIIKFRYVHTFNGNVAIYTLHFEGMKTFFSKLQG